MGNCCGTGSKVRLSTQACNAATADAAGSLLVPEVVIEAEPGIRVTPPADGDCPQVWRVGIDGAWTETPATSFLHTLDGPTWQFEPVTELPTLTIPRAGIWEIDYQVRGVSDIVAPNTGTRIGQNGVGAGLLRNGTLIPGSELLVIIQNQQPGDDAKHIQTTSNRQFMHAFASGDTLQLAARPFMDDPGGNANIFGTGVAHVISDANGWTHITAHWVGPAGDTPA